MAAGERVNVVAGQKPADYHCSCEYCSQVIGELRRPDGEYYHRLERRQYYVKEESGEKGHIAKTPLHIARWAVQAYTQPGDWVLDPTIGSGTTAVEALTQGRCAAGMELEYGAILAANVKKAVDGADGVEAHVAEGDARNIEPFLQDLGREFALVLNNPPYLGDVSMPTPAKEGYGPEFRHLERRFDYDKTLPNLAFLHENDEYWRTMAGIWGSCAARLKLGGHFVIGIKDTRKDHASTYLHRQFCDLLRDLGLTFVGTAFLKHHPTTFDQNSYLKRHGGDPGGVLALYQTISVFKRE